MSPLKILVTGSRRMKNNESNWHKVSQALIFESGGGPVRLIHGAAAGADSIAAEVADVAGWQVKAYAADWKTRGKAAGPIRNQLMLDVEAPDVLVAFPLAGSRGTWDMVARARKAGVRVVVVE